MLYIGIDLGTSAVKLLLMDSQGNICNIVSREYPLYFPHPGWSEQNPKDWYEQTMEGIRELLKDADKSQVAGISFGGQMHGLVILDEKDQVIRPAILWNDGRTTEECDYLNNVIGKEKLSEYTANISFTGFTAPKILWVKKNEPENFARIKKIMLPKDYIAYRLTGVHCTDVSDASGMLLFDVKNRCWSKEMCEICGVSEDQLATCYESYEKVGCLTKEAADTLGFPHKVVVAAGAGDNAAAAVGTGTVGDNMCNISLGTSGTIFISSNHFGVDQNNALHSFAHADGHYHLMGCMLSADEFSAEYAATEPEQFIKMLIERFNMGCAVAGFNYTFGRRGEGSVELIKKLGEKYGFAVEIVPPVMYRGEAVSSTRIRACLEAGRVKDAGEMLGAPYSITGPVIRNRGIGRTLDYPTANIAGWEDRAVPMAGVYATRAVLDGEKYPAVTNIGRNPTVNGEHTTIETHMLGFDADIYGQTLKVEFIERIRGEIRFPDVHTLATQMKADGEKARDILKNS